MNHQNCHARSKQKRKALRLRNFIKRVSDKRAEKREKAMKPKGVTIYGLAKEQAIHISELFPNGDYGFLFQSDRKKYPNQRQKRKLNRQVPQRRNK